MWCNTTASLRASATRAFLGPARLATASAQRLKSKVRRILRFLSVVAALAGCAAAYVAYLKSYITSISPDGIVSLGNYRMLRDPHCDISLGLLHGLERWPDPESCAQRDSFEIDWSRFRTEWDAQICLFRILDTLGGPEQGVAWLSAQHLKYNDHTRILPNASDRTLSVACTKHTESYSSLIAQWRRRYYILQPYAYDFSITYRNDRLVNIEIFANTI